MDEIIRIFHIMNIKCTDEKLRKLSEYMEGILKANKSINLTAITDRKEFIQKHYVDSLLCADLEEFLRAESIIDVGTGGGFPGIPLAIAFPDKEFTLIDSLRKRINIISDLSESLGILNVNAIHGRAEELSRKSGLRENFDLCISRAVANMSTLSEYCLPFVKNGGAFIAYKGPECRKEIEDAANAVNILGGKISGEKSIDIEGIPFDHRLVIIHKIENTLSKYPRKAGIPSKEPIK